MNKQQTGLRQKQIYFISFVEGGVVMVTEITGAKLLTPFFGASLYSWAATLSITLLALMAGYYYGGHLTTRPSFQPAKKVLVLFVLSGLSVLVMPWLGNFIMQKTISFSFFTGLIVSELIYLFPPIFLMGTISPVIVFMITEKAEMSGKSAGTIYAISTLGGIIFTLLFGFVIIPGFGITLPLKILGLLVVCLGLFFLSIKKNNAKKITPLAIACLLAWLFFKPAKAAQATGSGNKTIIETSEGLLGELKIVDQLSQPPNGKPVMIRKLRVNNIDQNFVFAQLPTQSLMYYVNFMKQLIDFFPAKKNVLLVGLGAGSIYKNLRDKEMNIETVEIDRRIYDYGIKYFGMEPHKNYVTDGRYFLNTTKKKYDLIILDVIIGENVPGQLITVECFKKCYDLLSDQGTLIIEHGGVHSFNTSGFVPSVIKTLRAAAFNVTLFNPLLSKSFGDVMFVASKHKFEPRSLVISDDILIKSNPLSAYSLPETIFDTLPAFVLTDDKNNADILLKSHYFKVREAIRKELASNTHR